MPRHARSQLSDGVYHVTARAGAGRALFIDDRDRERFLWLLNDYAARIDIRILAYCLMDTHYHLLLEGNSVDLGLLMQRLNGRYAQRYNARHDRYGHLFAERYSAWVIHDEAHFEQTVAYIDQNPVKTGLCRQSEDWPWTWFSGKPLGQTHSGSVPVSR
jgi:REP element-mobilizing transposase RayT